MLPCLPCSASLGVGWVGSFFFLLCVRSRVQGNQSTSLPTFAHLPLALLASTAWVVMGPGTTCAAQVGLGCFHYPQAGPWSPGPACPSQLLSDWLAAGSLLGRGRAKFRRESTPMSDNSHNNNKSLAETTSLSPACFTYDYMPAPTRSCQTKHDMCDSLLCPHTAEARRE